MLSSLHHHSACPLSGHVSTLPRVRRCLQPALIFIQTQGPVLGLAHALSMTASGSRSCIPLMGLFLRLLGLAPLYSCCSSLLRDLPCVDPPGSFLIGCESTNILNTLLLLPTQVHRFQMSMASLMAGGNTLLSKKYKLQKKKNVICP